MINNEKFNLATGSNTYNVVPLVIITNNDIVNYFSTYNLNLQELSFDPLLLNVSSIKESVDVETRKYKTSSVTVTLSNAKYLGRRLSDSYTDLINGDVQIFFKTQNINDLARAMLVYRGTVRRISQTDTTLTLNVEDASEQKVHKDIPESITSEIDFTSKFKNKPFPMVIGKVDRSPCVTSFGTTGEYDLDEDGELDNYEFVRDVFADRKELSKIISENEQVGRNIIGSTSLYVESDDTYVGIYPRTVIDFDNGLNAGHINFTTLATNNGFCFVNLFNDQPEPNEDGEITIEELAKNDTAANRGRVLVHRKENKIERKIQNIGADGNFEFTSGTVQDGVLIPDFNLNFDRINDGNPNTCVQIEGTFISKFEEFANLDFHLLSSTAFLKFNFDSLPSDVKIEINDNSSWTRIIAKIENLETTSGQFGSVFDEQGLDKITLPVISVFQLSTNAPQSFGSALLKVDPAFPEPLIRSFIGADFCRLLHKFGSLLEPEIDTNFIQAPPVGSIEQVLPTGDNTYFHTFATSESEYNSYDSDDIENNPISCINPHLVPAESNSYCLGLPKIRQLGSISNFIGIEIPVKIRIYESRLYAFGTIDNLLKKNFYANVWGRKSEFNFYSTSSILYTLNEGQFASPVQNLLNIIINATDSGEEILDVIENAMNDASPLLTSEMPYSFNIVPLKAVQYNSLGDVEKEVNIKSWGFSLSISNNMYFIDFNFQGLTKDENFEETFTIQLGNLNGEILDEYEISINSDKENIFISPIENPADIVKHILEEECKYDGEFNDDEFNAIKELHPDWNFAFTQSKLISSKKLIEDFSRSTKSFPRFRADGTFGWNVVKDIYSEDDIDLIIEESDIINYKYDRTKLEDVKTKVKVLFNIDYAQGNYLFSTDEILATDYVNTSIYQYYGLATDDSDSTLNFESDYIRDRYTAEQLQNWLLTWNMNQKNLISLTLPIKYIKLEVGDVVALDKEIQGTKIFGETYTQTSIDRNGQEIYPYFMVYETNKNLEKVDIKLIQLHNLDINSLGTVEEPETQQEESNVVLPTGDVNGDGNIDVVDIVNVVSFALGVKQPTDEEFFQADINQDGNIDVLDVVTLVNIILG